jgi:hypothetical protein
MAAFFKKLKSYEKMGVGAGFKPAPTALPKEDKKWNRIRRDSISPATGKW